MMAPANCDVQFPAPLYEEVRAAAASKRQSSSLLGERFSKHRFKSFLESELGYMPEFISFSLEAKQEGWECGFGKRVLNFTDSSKYLGYRKDLDLLTSLMPFFEQVDKISLAKAPYHSRLQLKKLKRLSSALALYKSNLENSFADLNSEKFSSENSIFEFKSESELWETRSKVYQYWM